MSQVITYWRRKLAERGRWWLQTEEAERAGSCVDRGWAHYLAGNTGLAKEALDEARDLLEKPWLKKPEKLLLGRVYLLLGHVYFNIEEYNKAAEQYGKTVRFAEKQGRDVETQLCYYRLCLIRADSKANVRTPENICKEYDKTRLDNLGVGQRAAFLMKLADAYFDLYQTIPLESIGQDPQLARAILDKARTTWSKAAALKAADDGQSDRLGAISYFEAQLAEKSDKNKAISLLEDARERFAAALEKATDAAKAGAHSDLAFTQAFLGRLTDAGSGQIEFCTEAAKNFKAAFGFARGTRIKANFRLRLVEILNQLAVSYMSEPEKPDLETAIERIREAIQLAETPDPVSYWNLGNGLYQKKQYHDAAQAWEKAVELDRGNAYYWYSLATAYDSQKDYQGAATAWKQAVQLDTENADYLNWLGTAYRNAKDYEKAADAYRGAVEKNGKPVFLRNLGNTYLAWNRPDEALPVYRRLAEIDGGNWNSHYLMGRSYRLKKDFDKARDEYQSALALVPKDDLQAQVSVRRSLGFLHQASGNSDAAIPHLEWVWDQNLRQKVQDTDVQLALAECYAKKGRSQETFAQLCAARKAAPSEKQIAQAIIDDFNTLGQLAVGNIDWLVLFRDVCMEQGVYGWAVAADKQLLRLAPNRPGFERRLGQSQLRLGAYRKAIDAFSKAAEVEADSASLQSELGDAYSRQENNPKAAAAFQRATQLEPENAVWHYRLGMQNLKSGSLDKAASELGEALRLKPDELEFRRELALCLVNQDKYQGALDVLEKAPVPPDDKEYLVDLANAYALNDRYADAVRVTEQLKGAGNYDQLGVTLRRLADSAGVAERHSAFADVNSELDRIEVAVIAYRRAVALDAANAEHHKKLGGALYKKNDFQGAAREWEKTVQQEPDDARTINNLGTAYDAMGKRQEALEQYKRAAELTLDNFVPAYNVGTANYREGNTAEALEAFNKSASLSANLSESLRNDYVARAHYNIGNCHFRLDRKDDARKEWEKAVELDARLAEAQFNLGVLLWTAGNKDEAKQKWQAALQANRNMAEAEDNIEAADQGGNVDLAIWDLNRK